MEPWPIRTTHLPGEMQLPLRAVAPRRPRPLLYRQAAIEAVKKTTLLIWPQPEGLQAWQWYSK
jgi:hypothetical protein